MICGVDPGNEGALALLDAKGGLIDVVDMPAVEIKVAGSDRMRVAPAGLAEILRRWNPAHVVIERVQGLPTDGGARAFAFGFAAGAVAGVVATLGLPMTYVTPQKWKAASGVTKDKETCRQRALELWPAHAGKFARKSVDGDRAEACLIARYGIMALRLVELGNAAA